MIYNLDHGNHIANAQALNAGKIEGAGSVADGAVAVFDGVSGSALRSGGGAPVLTPVDTADISDNAVTYAKMQNVSATSRILGRKTAGAGDVEECTLSEVLDFISSAAQGDILTRGAAGWQRLAAGASGTFLKSNGAAADLSYAAAGITAATEQATTSGTAFDFTSLPAGLRRITVIFNEVSLSGTDDLLIQIGDAGGLETTGYLSTSAGLSSSTAGFISRSANAGVVTSGLYTLVRIGTGNIWIGGGTTKLATNSVAISGGSKTLSDVLTQVRITRTGTNTFDAGSVNIIYE